MAVVISSEDSDFFSSAPLRRSHSQPTFLSNQASRLHSSSSSATSIGSLYQDTYRRSYKAAPPSDTSSAPSSPSTVHADSVDLSYSSTPATTISLDGSYGEDLDLDTDDTILLPSYDQNPYFAHIEDLESSTTTNESGDSYHTPSADKIPSTATPQPESPDPLEHAEDDTAVKHHPTRHVDYLSHDWKEEDIWSSWRYIVSKRSEYTNAPRLENASWRTWMKSKYGLKTVSPEALNWLKDCDVTWLYGPLQTRQSKLSPGGTGQGSSTLSRNDSFVNKKPILKKRSMSEVMLQKSISSSSLVKQAAAAVQAQQSDVATRVTRPILQRAATDYITFPFASRSSRNDSSQLPSSATSGLVTPSERKHIHFDEQVKQCIAVEIKGDDEEEEEDTTHWKYDDDSESDDEAIMMKQTRTKKKPVRPRLGSTQSDTQTIAMLPSTTLKYREDTPEPTETAMKHSTGIRSPLLSPSSSQETLRPSKQSGRFSFGDDEDDESDEETSITPVSSPVDTFSSKRSAGLQRSASANNLAAAPAGMRRTESGMLMPYEDGNDPGNDGIIGRVIDTVNTARDIAHVIWNVGWRR